MTGVLKPRSRSIPLSLGTAEDEVFHEFSAL